VRWVLLRSKAGPRRSLLWGISGVLVYALLKGLLIAWGLHVVSLVIVRGELTWRLETIGVKVLVLPIVLLHRVGVTLVRLLTELHLWTFLIGVLVYLLRCLVRRVSIVIKGTRVRVLLLGWLKGQVLLSVALGGVRLSVVIKRGLYTLARAGRLKLGLLDRSRDIVRLLLFDWQRSLLSF